MCFLASICANNERTLLTSAAHSCIIAADRSWDISQQGAKTSMLTRRQLIASSAGLLLAGASSSANAQSNLEINSTRYISINADTGAVFAQRDAHEQVAIASLTKVFTAMEAIQLAPLDSLITTTADDFQPAEATVMGFGAGETFTLEELMYGMMLPSGNDAAYAIARSLGYQEGDTAEEAVQRFMDLVNQRVTAMGLTNTHLLNPDGWGIPGHYSSAADVAAFMAYASTSDFLMRVMGTYRYTTRAGYVLLNTNRTLTTAPSVLAGKTGYDGDSGWCLVQIAQRDNTRIIAVNLDGIAPGDWYNDNLLLLDHGFTRQTALGGEPFQGEVVNWNDPAPALFAQAGPGLATVAGETDEQETIVDQEVTAPQPIRLEAEPEPEQQSVAFTGRKSDSTVAGIGAAALVGAMATSRWRDFGGDSSADTIGPSLRAGGDSLKRMLPSIPSIGRQSASVEESESGADQQIPANEDRHVSTDEAMDSTRD